MKNKTLLMLSSSLELATGVVAMAAPSLLTDVLFSSGLTPGGRAIGRVGGFGLFSLAIACWPRVEDQRMQPIRALFLYNFLAACFLGYLRAVGEFSSPFLLPACAVHGVLALLFARPVFESAVGRGTEI
jgi:hypothetical protein